jgi:hypothetical protein
MPRLVFSCWAQPPQRILLIAVAKNERILTPIVNCGDVRSPRRSHGSRNGQPMDTFLLPVAAYTRIQPNHHYKSFKRARAKYIPSSEDANSHLVRYQHQQASFASKASRDPQTYVFVRDAHCQKNMRRATNILFQFVQATGRAGLAGQSHPAARVQDGAKLGWLQLLRQTCWADVIRLWAWRIAPGTSPGPLTAGPSCPTLLISVSDGKEPVQDSVFSICAHVKF